MIILYNSSFIYKLLYKKLIFKGNYNRSLFILYNMICMLTIKHNTKNILLILEYAIFNILIPINFYKNKYNKIIYKIKGVSLDKMINSALNSILYTIKINYKHPIHIKLTNEISNLYYKQGQLYSCKLNILKSNLKYI